MANFINSRKSTSRGLAGSNFRIAGEDDNLLDDLQSVERFIDDALQRNGLAATEACVADNDNVRLRVFDAVAQRGVAQAGVDHGVDRADARARQHRDDALQRERHVDDDTIALLHAERLQPIREAADVAIKLAVSNEPLGAIFRQPDECNSVAVRGIGVAVESIDGDVRARPRNHL